MSHYKRNPREVEKRIVKNQVWCAQAHQHKLKFETEQKAERHLKWLNPEDFIEGRMPIRAYKCSACCGWHVTSKDKKSNDGGFQSYET